jgi:uncharacterized protein (TIGR00730 family)
MTRSNICVFCASSDHIDSRYLELADDVGRAIGERSWTCVSGGGSVSMMGRLVRSVRAHGGHTIGVIPQALKDREVADLDADELVVTHDMRQRKGIMDERSDGFLALPGGIGTLEELMEVWTSRSLTMHDKPVVVLDPWDDYALLRAQVAAWVERGFVSQASLDRVHWTTTVDEALDALTESGLPGGISMVE